MIVFISNHIHHHQYPFSKEMYGLLGGDYRFVEMERIPEQFIRNGYPDYGNLPWLIRAWESPDKESEAHRLTLEADVVIYGGVYPYSWIRERLNAGRLTFEYGERWLKRGLLNLLSPNLLRNQWNYHLHFSGKPLYRLNAGAWCSDDMRLLHSFKGRCFKWGYFTDVPETDINALHSKRSDNGPLRIIWCARFINWKHPETAIEAAAILRSKNIGFSLEMYGAGPLLDKVKNMAQELVPEGNIRFPGTVSNQTILQRMEEADIMVLTSDRREGWGAVINEAMSRGCCVICTNAIGSAPWLIEDGISGLLFRPRDAKGLAGKLESLASDRQRIRETGSAAYRRMLSFTPRKAAEGFLNLAKALQTGDSKLIPAAGPGSRC